MANHNPRWWVHLAICLLLTGTGVLARQAHAQDQQDQKVLSITEIDPNGKSFHDIQDNSPIIVDVNSTIRIAINKDVLRSRTAGLKSDSLLAQQIDKAVTLQEAAQKGFEALPQLRDALDNWVKADPAARNLRQLRTALAPLDVAVLAILDLAEEEETLLDEINRRLTGDEVEQYRGVLEAAAAEAARLRSQIDTILDREGVYYQMGAWIVSNGDPRPLHLPGFDDYPEAEEFVVERFNFQLSADQLSRLQNLESQALDLQTRGIPAVFDGFKASVPSLLSEFLGPAGETLSSVESPIDNLLNQLSAAKDSVRQVVEETKKQTLDYRDLLGRLKAEYIDGGGPSFNSLSGFISKLNQDWSSLRTQTKSLIRTFNELEKLPDQFLDNDPLRQSVTDLVQRITSIAGILRSDIPDDDIVSKISNAFGGLGSIDEINTEALEFGEEVRKFDISNLPDHTELSLINSGARASGDAIVIKIAAGSEDFNRRDLETYQLQLFRVTSYIKTVTGLIYAIPENGDFVIGPAYNVLFSWGSRKSTQFNSLWMPGIGLGLSAINFKKDSTTPQVGVSFVFSFFRDYIQLGGGLNVQEKVGFGFFGLSLPLPSQTVGL